jgi:DNA-binding XRE family transcriptional regulator
MNNLGDDGYKDICHRIEEKPVPVVKEKRQYTRRDSTVTPEEAETIIDIIRQNPSISQNDLAQKAGLSRSTVVIIMDTLKDAGRLTRVGSCRKGKWVIHGNLKVAEPQIAEEKKVEEKTHETKTGEKKSASATQNSDNDRVEKILDVLSKQTVFGH